MTDELPTPEEIIAAHDRIEELYDLKYPGILKAAPKRTLRREVLEPALNTMIHTIEQRRCSGR